MTTPFQPTALQAIGNLLAVAWSDGAENFIPLETVRKACPCATCGGEPDVLGRIERPEVKYTDNSFELIGWQIVGGYGWQPRWADGHGTGIYTFPYLRRLGDSVA